MLIQQVQQYLSYFIPETILASTLCLVILSGLIFKKHPKVQATLSFIGVTFSLYFSILQVGLNQEIFSGMIAVDTFAVFFKIFCSVCTLFIFAFSVISSEVKSAVKRTTEYYALIISATLGMFLMAGASNLLMMVLSMELASLSSYILAGYTKEKNNSSEASLKYVIYGAVSSAIMLYGVSIIFGLSGNLGYAGINKYFALNLPDTLILTTTIILIIVGFGYKISAVPFHFWTPDVYEGAPITITAFLSVASKAAGFAMVIRFFKIIFFDASATYTTTGIWQSLNGFEWNKILAIISVLTMTLGNLVAIWQNNLKRLLAYSSIAHAGYMLMGIVLLSNDGIAAVLVYLIVYMFMNLGAFFIVMLIANKTGSEDIETYSGIGYKAPLIGVAMTIFLVSLTGLPPTAGFIGKFYLFSALLSNSNWIWLAIIGAVNSVISLFYYARVFKYIFLKSAPVESQTIKLNISEIIIILLLVIPTILFGLYFTPIVEFAKSSVQMFGI